MGRRKEAVNAETNKFDKSSPSQKCERQRQKRHVHKRHRRRKIHIVVGDAVLEQPTNSKSHRHKIKINKDNPKVIEKKSQPATPRAASPKTTLKKKKGIRGKESGTSSEEERWLDAIESGKLEEVDDELKKIKPKDPKMMTARQRAMYKRGGEKEPVLGGQALMALPSGYKEKVMTAEDIQKAAIKSQKRKQLADEKREKDKKKTMERLLKKQDSKNIKGSIKGKPIKMQVPLISYRNTADGITISLPEGIDFPLRKKTATDPPKPVICAVPECTNIKRYACSQTGIPLCSLECYKINLVNIVVS